MKGEDLRGHKRVRLGVEAKLQGTEHRVLDSLLVHGLTAETLLPQVAYLSSAVGDVLGLAACETGRAKNFAHGVPPPSRGATLGKGP